MAKQWVLYSNLDLDLYADTVETAEIVETVDTAETADTEETADTVDTAETAETVETSETVKTVETDETVYAVETEDIAETVETEETDYRDGGDCGAVLVCSRDVFGASIPVPLIAFEQLSLYSEAFRRQSAALLDHY